MYYGKFIEEVIELALKTDGLYIYGAGLRGKEVYHILHRNNIEVEGFVVTKIGEKRETLGLKIIEIGEVISENIGIVVGLGDIYSKEVFDYLKSINADFNKIVDGGKYISIDRGSRDLQDNPTIEITTVIGCSVACKYCPQKLLNTKYCESNYSRERFLSIEDFKKILKNSSENCDLMFAGMAEPYLNPNCTEMLKLACATGRNVSLYTTLQGATNEDIDTILGLPFKFVGLHVADEKNFAKIETSEEYYKHIEQLINAKKANGDPFVNDISAQANPLPRIRNIISGKYEVLVSLQDRAGNLEGDELAGRDKPLTNEKITCCFSGPKLNNHVVLPDGTLLLCNMDYGMKHKLGNIFEKSFDDIRKDEEMQKVFRGIKGDTREDILCRNCLFAMVEKE